jgi:hypothetical protein
MFLSAEDGGGWSHDFVSLTGEGIRVLGFLFLITRRKGEVCSISYPCLSIPLLCLVRRRKGAVSFGWDRGGENSTQPVKLGTVS